MDWEKNILSINRAVLYTPEKGIYDDTLKHENSVRYYHLPDWVMEIFKDYKTLQDLMKKYYGDSYDESREYVFTGDDGNVMHPDTITHHLSKFSKKHDLPHIFPHRFRYTVASMLIAAGMDPQSVADYLGDNVATILAFYTHAFAKKRAESATAISKEIINIMK